VLLIAALMISRQTYPSVTAMWSRARLPVIAASVLFVVLAALDIHVAVLLIAAAYAALPWMQRSRINP
jgi:hypothetical protein